MSADTETRGSPFIPSIPPQTAPTSSATSRDSSRSFLVAQSHHLLGKGSLTNLTTATYPTPTPGKLSPHTPHQRGSPDSCSPALDQQALWLFSWKHPLLGSAPSPEPVEGLYSSAVLCMPLPHWLLPLPLSPLSDDPMGELLWCRPCEWEMPSGKPWQGGFLGAKASTAGDTPSSLPGVL